MLPPHLQSMLSEKDSSINNLQPAELIEMHSAGEIKLFVDRGLALMAARSGVPVSGLATLFALLFPVLIVLAIPLLIFVSWQFATLSVLTAIVSFRASRHFTKEDVGKAALRNPQLLNLLMRKGVVWFESK